MARSPRSSVPSLSLVLRAVGGFPACGRSTAPTPRACLASLLDGSSAGRPVGRGCRGHVQASIEENGLRQPYMPCAGPTSQRNVYDVTIAESVVQVHPPVLHSGCHRASWPWCRSRASSVTIRETRHPRVLAWPRDAAGRMRSAVRGATTDGDGAFVLRGLPAASLNVGPESTGRVR